MRLQNLRMLLSSPQLAWEYTKYRWSRGRDGNARREINGINVTNITCFGEYHWCKKFVSEQEWAFFESFPFESGALMDVGANLGLVSMTLARRYPTRTVHAFEPNDSTFSALRANCIANGCNNVHVHNCAVSDQVGEIAFFAQDNDRGRARLSYGGGASTGAVKCVSLDQAIEEQGIEQIALLKVDVEGFETAVFQGAERMLANRTAAMIYYEVCPELTRDAGYEPDRPSIILRESGYKLYTLGVGGELLPAQPATINSVQLENWVAIRS